LPLSLSLNYNSRIWSRHGTSAVTFNAVNTWPYLGFTLSFGRIVTYPAGSNTKFVLIDSDGTRHYLGSGPGGTSTTYQTNDGSHITYVGTATGGGTLYYNNGITKSVWMVNNRLLVSQIQDSNGNYITISYASQSFPSCQSGAGFQWKQAISSITDTLGRVVSFNYDSCNNLVSITGPDQGGTTSTIAQFDYNVTNVSNSFSGLTIENRPTGNVVELSHIYFPQTQTGYKFSYSAYGMIYNVSMRKQMSIDQNGVISDGTEKAYVTFNYPTVASSLTDAPAFTQWTQYPAATSGGTATYSFTNGGTPGTNKTFTITRPDSSTVALTRSDASGVSFGLLTKTEGKNTGGGTMAKSELTYANDPGGQPQIQNVVSYDDTLSLNPPGTGNPVKVDFDYDSYGNVLNRREYGFKQSGQFVVRRRSRSVYKTDSAYLNAYLRSLVIESDVYDAQLDTNDANDVLIAKTTNTWDSYADMGNMENYGGNYGGGSAPPGYNTAYNNQSLTVRGNLTGQTIYSDVVTPVSMTYNKKIDIFGNVVQEQVSCCNLNTYVYSGTTNWSTPEQVIKGDPNGVHQTKLITHDFNTSLITEETDPNSQQTTFGYDNAGRLTQATLPTGETASRSYNDSTPSTSQSVSYDDGGTQRTVSSSTVYDGLGRVIQQVDANGGQVNTSYDAMGRVISVTNPFLAGGTPGPATSYTYDALGRVTVTTLPDTQTTQTSYNGPTVTLIDQVNRKTQRVNDGLGRLVTVNEQDVSTGSLNQATNYSYDYLNNLTQVDQGGQLRKFKYDSLGRLLYEKIPEQSATINDGTGTLWTGKYTYTSFNAISTKQDARGVIATYSYGTLNRLTQVSYNTVSGVTTAPTVTYTFDSDPTYGTTAQGMLVRVNVGTDYQERYTFDTSFRVASTIRTIGSRTYTTSYSYNQGSQLKQLTYPSSRAVNVTYDTQGRLSGLAEGGNGTTWLSSVSYNIAGQVTGDTLGNGVTEVFGYDTNRMQLTSQKAGTASPYTNRMNLTYSYQASAGQMGSGSTAGNAGQLMSISGTSTINGTTESATYTYDNLGRLVTSNQTSNGSSAQRRFSYDRWGNRTGVWDATSGGNQIQSITLQQSGGGPTNQIASVTSGSTINYTYDAAGNVTNDGAHSYGYDSENRIVTVDGGSTASYAYDHQNRRYKKTVGSTVTHYVWLGSRVLAEHNGSTGAVLIDYVYSGSRQIGKVTSGTPQYFLSDRLSVRLSLDSSGNVLGRQAHLPFGEDFGESGTQEKHHFTSYERDGETGADYGINRGYSSSVGRFQSADPYRPSGYLVNPRSWNRYAYSRNDPANRIDPLGLEDVPSLGSIDVSAGPPEGSISASAAATIGAIGEANVGQLLGGNESGGGAGEPAVGGEPPKDAKFSQEAFENCAEKLFIPKNASPAEKAFFEGALHDLITKMHPVSKDDLGKDPYGIYFDYTSRSKKDLGGVAGYDQTTPNIIYFANNYFTPDQWPNGFLSGPVGSPQYEFGSAVLYHEIGNWIAAKLHVTPKISPNNKEGDAGAEMELCMYGGYVNKDGKVYPTP
jgi:RHS repeat-associated protein